MPTIWLTNQGVGKNVKYKLLYLTYLSIRSVDVFYGKCESMLDLPGIVKQVFSTQEQGSHAAVEVLRSKELNDQ